MSRTTNHFPRALPILLLGLMTACGGDKTQDARFPDVLVFQSRQSIQCGSKGLTPDQGAQRLINGGIDVVRSGCGAMTNVAFPAVCGNANGEILLHEIRRENLPDAERLGLQSIETLRNPTDGAGYVWTDCDTGQVLL